MTRTWTTAARPAASELLAAKPQLDPAPGTTWWVSVSRHGLAQVTARIDDKNRRLRQEGSAGGFS